METDTKIFNYSVEDHWREDHTCSYCGGIKPQKVIELVRKGYTITRTDKKYKIYIETDNRESSELPNKQTMWKVYLPHFSKTEIDDLNRALGLIV